VNETDPLEVFDDGDRAVVGNEADEGFAAAGNDAVDQRVELEQRGECGAIGRGNELHSVDRQRGGSERFGDKGGESGVGVEALLAAAQDGGVAALEAEDGAVDGDVGTGFVD